MKNTFYKIITRIDGKENIVFFVFFAIYFSMLIFFGINKPVWHDENHFVDTINYFGETPLFQALHNYDEMSTPLPFILFSLWGKIFGFHLISLRILSLFLASATYWLLYLFFSKHLIKSTALFLTIFIALNPYFIGASIFVFTDMTAILFMVLAFVALYNKSPLLLLLGLSGALLSRQYFAFLIPSFFIFYFLKFLNEDNKLNSLQNILAVLLSCIPLMVLFIYWGSTCPDNTVKKLFMNNVYQFHFNSLFLYSAQIVLYTIPISIVCNWNLYKNKKSILISALLSVAYFLNPIEVSPSALLINRSTVGYLNRAIELIKIRGLSQFVFYAGFLFSIPVIIHWITVFIRKLKTKDFDIDFLLIMTMFSFLVVMPFSYLIWEKYFIPVLPTVMYLLINKKTSKCLCHNLSD